MCIAPYFVSNKLILLMLWCKITKESYMITSTKHQPKISRRASNTCSHWPSSAIWLRICTVSAPMIRRWLKCAWFVLFAGDRDVGGIKLLRQELETRSTWAQHSRNRAHLLLYRSSCQISRLSRNLCHRMAGKWKIQAIRQRTNTRRKHRMKCCGQIWQDHSSSGTKP